MTGANASVLYESLAINSVPGHVTYVVQNEIALQWLRLKGTCKKPENIFNRSNFNSEFHLAFYKFSFSIDIMYLVQNITAVLENVRSWYYCHLCVPSDVNSAQTKF